MFEKVWSIVFAMSEKSETSTLFTFKCRIRLAEGFPVILRTIVQTFFYRSATIDFRYKGMPGLAFGRFYSAPGFGLDDTEIFYISRNGDVFTFRVAFLLLRMEFMHSSFSQTGSRFFDRVLLLGIVLLPISVRMSVKCSMGSSKLSE